MRGRAAARPAPVDFHARCMVMGTLPLRRFYDASHETIVRWIDEALTAEEKVARVAAMKAIHFEATSRGRAARVAKFDQHMPADFAAQYIKANRITTLARSIGCTPAMLKGWVNRLPASVREERAARIAAMPKTVRGSRVRSPEQKLAEAAKNKAARAAAKAVRVAALPPKPRKPPKPAKVVEAAAPKRTAAGYRSRGNAVSRFATESNARSVAQLAATFLQRKIIPVYSAAVLHKACEGEWIVGRQRMPEAEMIAMAKKRGWDIDAWRKLAA